MNGMGNRSMTKRAWKAQGGLAYSVQYVGRAAKRRTKGRNATELRRQGRRMCAGAGDR